MKGFAAFAAGIGTAILAIGGFSAVSNMPLIGQPWYEGLVGGVAVHRYGPPAARSPRDGMALALPEDLLANASEALGRMMPRLWGKAKRQPVAPFGAPKTVMTTIFWAGEGAGPDNGGVSNVMSAWDSRWAERFGGIDSPYDRCGFSPCSFAPKENPFYVALPYGEYGDDGRLKRTARDVPWYEERKGDASILKNQWVKVAYRGTTCYGQWEDVGPNESDDFAYVFGTALPKNTFGMRAGLDVSPAIRDCLGMADNDYTTWSFVKEADVPEGPWKLVVTTSEASWD